MLKGFTVPKSSFGQAALTAAHTRWRAGCDHNDGTSSVPSKKGAGKATSFVVANFYARTTAAFADRRWAYGILEIPHFG
jgi:hypothetical protein